MATEQDSDAQKKLAEDLYEAVRNNDVTKVRSLLGQGADPNHQLYWSDEWVNEPPLHSACRLGYLEIVKTLVTHGARTDKGGGVDNRTPLHWACWGGHKEVVQYFKEVGCSTDVRDDDNMTPLHYACMGGSKDMVQYLVEEMKMDVDARDKLNLTPLHTACMGGGSILVVQYLVEVCKVDVDVTDDYGITPLDKAVEWEKTEVADYLKPLVSTPEPGTPLTEEDSDALEKLLLDNKISLTGERTYETVEHYLRELGHEKLATNLRANLDKVIGEQKRYLKKLDDLMTDKDTISMQYLRLLLVGPPSVGKTTTLGRLLKDIVNISSAGDKANLRSTLLTNCHQVVAYMNKDATEWVCSKDVEEEAKILFGYMYSSKVPSDKKTKTVPESEKHTNTAKPPSPENPRSKPQEETHTERRENAYQQNRLIPIKARLQKLIKNGNYSEMAKCLGNTLLNINDVGGQPAFLEMLPALCNGPAMYLVFLDLSKELDKPYDIPFSRDNTVITPFKAVHTVEATVSQILSAIASIHHVSREDATNKTTSKLSEKFEKFQQVRPVAALIGTHVDKLENPKEKIKQVNDALKATTQKFTEILVSPPSDSESSFFAVDNFAGTEQSDIAPIRDFMSNVFACHFKDASLPIKPKWLLLGTLLRIEYSIVSMEDCLEIGRLLEMDEEDTKFCLWYLQKIGSILHYGNVPNDIDGWLSNHMFCSPEVIFTSISQLILAALRILHSEGHVTEFERAELVKMGQFSLEAIIKYCNGPDVTKMLKEGEIIPAEHLIILLQYLNLLSEIVHQDANDPKVTRITYLMPAILDCASQEELTNPPPPDTNNPEPLHITFSFGYVPTGVFCGLITRLVSQGPHGILGLTWELVEDGVKRNCVSFYVDYVHKVTLLSHDRSYEIRVERNPEQMNFHLHDLCSHTLSAILYSLKILFPKLILSVAFQCSCPKHAASKSLNNLCTLVQGRQIHFLCGRSPVTLSEAQQVWLGKHVCLGSRTELEVLKFAEDGFSFHWSKEGSRRQIKTTDDQPNTVSFPSVREEDFGHYQCEVKDAAAGKVLLTLYTALYKEDTNPLASGQRKRSLPSDVEVESLSKRPNDVTVQGSSSEKDTSNGGSTHQPIVLTGDDIQAIRESLKNASKDWFDLGLAFGVKINVLENIEDDYRHNDRRLMKVVAKRLEVTDPEHPMTWPYICECLRRPTVERNDVAEEIEDKYVRTATAVAHSATN
ncbi:uncharacterized protein LOC135352329 isoform X2 [Halichondria panicea]|uniref:uncharacterized protein LOC135352329 isoform X2 n=1 Tax=Halichondria panicea TaxID=6063 RepID=UPI00312B6752